MTEQDEESWNHIEYLNKRYGSRAWDVYKISLMLEEALGSVIYNKEGIYDLADQIDQVERTMKS